jgi:hypothetical protein
MLNVSELVVVERVVKVTQPETGAVLEGAEAVVLGIIFF